ncbi:hypothetical protein M407DRAFT_23898 [Tulasnella calospora MUT 4182]|uniref:Protein kinase domain-containing protein n=1 Tax=Tulasnella calospora MUT 4182 TaxID=1051891 RepID=A0A0C3KZQ5_9AGAM|nr:hypothetical protein M407DRAFT_23898 [Tulasnella calospora MUT 4182]
MGDESHNADADVPGPVESELTGSSGGFEPSPKLRVRIEKLAYWRINPLSITFPENTREFRGGHAIVSKALMYSQEGYKFRKIDVAVKNPMIGDNKKFEQALGLAIREAEFLAELFHPNIVHFEGFVEDASKSIIWLVFPWEDNGNLQDFIALVDWEIPERISLIDDVARGLAHLHSRAPPICHGDLKSLNFLVDRNGVAALTDFGSARRIPQRDINKQIEQVESQPRALNEDSLCLGSDIWALGWIAYEVMTNSLPFQDASTDIVVVERVLGGELPSLTEIAHLSLIHELCSLMNMCWKNTPAERPTADWCRESIKQMPMFVPEVDQDKSGYRLLPIGRLDELGHMYQSWGEYPRAFDFFVQALQQSRICGEPKRLVSSLRNLAQLHRLRNEYKKAIPLYSEVLKIRTDLGDAKGRIGSLWALANAHRDLDEYDKAIPLYSEVLEIRTNFGDTKGRADALWALANAHRHRNDYDDAIPLYAEALEIHTDLSDGEGRAKALLGLAYVHENRDEYDKAIPLYSEVLEIRTDFGDTKGRADVLWALANAHRHLDDYDEAIPLYSEALEIHSDLNDREGREPRLCWVSLSRIVIDTSTTRKGRADALWALANAHRDLDEYGKAMPLYSEVLEIRTDFGDTKGRADVLWALANAHRHLDDYNEAIPLYSETLEIRTNLSDKKGRAKALLGLAYVHEDQHEYDKAIPLYSEALEIRTELDDRKGRADALLSLAYVHENREEYEKAILLYPEALEIRTDLDDREGRADALLNLALVHENRDEYTKAIPLYSEALEILTDVTNTEVRADLLRALANAHQHRAEHDKTIPLYSEALEILTDLGDREDRADVLWALANAHRHLDEYDKAIQLYSEVLEIRTDLGDGEGQVAAVLGLANVYRDQKLGEEDAMANTLEDAADVSQSLQPQEVAGDLEETFRIRSGLKLISRGIIILSIIYLIYLILSIQEG